MKHCSINLRNLPIVLITIELQTCKSKTLPFFRILDQMSDGSRNSSPSVSKDLNGEASCPDDSSMSAQELNHSQSSDGDNESDTEYDPEILAAIEASREEAGKDHVDPAIAAAIAASMKEAENLEEDNHVDSNETKENSNDKDENLDENSQLSNDQSDTSERHDEN